ncbi:MAG TPA: DUF1259 domain-containing protein [Pyrinomonadaceae bacterium]|jgi:hypothetical protein
MLFGNHVFKQLTVQILVALFVTMCAGDFVMIAGEVNPVIKALRDNGIEVTALHSHMLTENPRFSFMHFWANDDALKLARGLRAALDKDRIRVNPR